MRDEHIIEILDNSPVGSLPAETLDFVQTHSKRCSSCNSAYRAAIASSALLRQRVEAGVEPSPFFQTRVMAAWRERQTAENVPALLRLWRSAGALVSTMAVTTVALAVLSVIYPAPTQQVSEPVVATYSAESVLMEQTADEQLSDEQVLSTIYAEYDEAR
jgi:anti-sigma-K factor RskA